MSGTPGARQERRGALGPWSLTGWGLSALVLCAGCATPVGVVAEPAPTLRRARYVAPPDPELPDPAPTFEERRALEAEWPPVSIFPEAPPPPLGPLRVRLVSCARPVVWQCEPVAAAGPAWSCGPGPGAVSVHVVRTPDRAPPRIVVVRGR